MILEITIHDNDFTNIIEEFLDQYHMDARMMINLLKDPYKDDHKKYYEISTECDKILDDIYNDFGKLTEEHINNYIDLIKRCLLAYTEKEYSAEYGYVNHNLSIKNVKSVKSKWQNAEVVYWFVGFRKYITM